MTTDNKRQTRLQKLSGSDFEIVDGQPDIRGWEVTDASDKKIGKVKELIFDTESRKVRYLVVDTNHNDYDLDSKKVLVPIGVSELAKEDDRVYLPGVTADQMRALPVYDEDRFSDEDETNIRNVFGGLGAAALAGGSLGDADFYNHEHFNDENFYKNRDYGNSVNDDEIVIPVVEENLNINKDTVQTGGVRLTSRKVERPVEKDITLKEENVSVKRNTVNRKATGDDYKEAETEIVQHAERPVVTKDARIVEEVSLNKNVTEKTETVKDTLRNTKVDVDDLEN